MASQYAHQERMDIDEYDSDATISTPPSPQSSHAWKGYDNDETPIAYMQSPPPCPGLPRTQLPGTTTPETTAATSSPVAEASPSTPLNSVVLKHPPSRRLKALRKVLSSPTPTPTTPSRRRTLAGKSPVDSIGKQHLRKRKAKSSVMAESSSAIAPESQIQAPDTPAPNLEIPAQADSLSSSHRTISPLFGPVPTSSAETKAAAPRNLLCSCTQSPSPNLQVDSKPLNTSAPPSQDTPFLCRSCSEIYTHHSPACSQQKGIAYITPAMYADYACIACYSGMNGAERKEYDDRFFEKWGPTQGCMYTEGWAWGRETEYYLEMFDGIVGKEMER